MAHRDAWPLRCAPASRVLFVGLTDPARVMALDHRRARRRSRRVAICVLVALLLFSVAALLALARDVAAQPAHLGRARQHDPGPVHVRRRGAADPLQRTLSRDVWADARAGLSRRAPCAICSNIRKANGTFHQDIDEYVAAAKRRVVEGKVFNNIVEVRGRTISINNRPTAGGGWVSTHEDISEQRRQDQERDLMHGAGRSAAPPSKRRSRCSDRASRPC